MQSWLQVANIEIQSDIGCCTIHNNPLAIVVVQPVFVFRHRRGSRICFLSNEEQVSRQTTPLTGLSLCTNIKIMQSWLQVANIEIQSDIGCCTIHNSPPTIVIVQPVFVFRHKRGCRICFLSNKEQITRQATPLIGLSLCTNIKVMQSRLQVADV